ncbi:MAG: enoyl-CoA hydratase-related protein [Pseudomonadota bacterium]
MIDYTPGQIARLTLNAPERHNALSLEDMAALSEALTAVENSEARVLILTGTGKSFCAGVSLGAVADHDFTDNPLTPLCDQLERLRPVTLCALNGGVYGGGIELALSCDFRLGGHNVKARLPAAQLGIHYTSEGMGRAVRVLGLQTARRLFLTGETLEAQALLACGFLDRATVEDAHKTAQGWAQDIASLAPLAVQGMKRSLVEIAKGTQDHDAARARIAACFASADHAEGLAAQKDKRPPRFEGR